MRDVAGRDRQGRNPGTHLDPHRVRHRERDGVQQCAERAVRPPPERSLHGQGVPGRDLPGVHRGGRLRPGGRRPQPLALVISFPVNAPFCWLTASAQSDFRAGCGRGRSCRASSSERRYSIQESSREREEALAPAAPPTTARAPPGPARGRGPQPEEHSIVLNPGRPREGPLAGMRWGPARRPQQGLSVGAVPSPRRTPAAACVSSRGAHWPLWWNRKRSFGRRMRNGFLRTMA